MVPTTTLYTDTTYNSSHATVICTPIRFISLSTIAPSTTHLVNPSVLSSKRAPVFFPFGRKTETVHLAHENPVASNHNV